MLLLDGQVHHDTHVIPMGNYVIGVGNYVSADSSNVGNYVSADSHVRFTNPFTSRGMGLRLYRLKLGQR